MWKYIKPYIVFMVLAITCMILEVTLDLLQPKLMSTIIDDGVLKSDMALIYHYGFLMLGAAVCGLLGGTLNTIFVTVSGQKIANSLRKDCFSKIMELSPSQIHKFGCGSLITRISNDTIQVQNFVIMMVRGLVRTSFMLIGSIYFMFQLNPGYGKAVLIAFPFMVGAVIFCFVKSPFAELQSSTDDLNTVMHEDILAIRTIKACVKELFEIERFAKANLKLALTQRKIQNILACIFPSVNLLIGLLVAAILYHGFESNLQPGLVMAAITYMTLILFSVMMLIMLFQHLVRGIVSWRRINELLITEPNLKGGNFDGETQIQGEVEFKEVSFAYVGTNTILNNISFKILPGEFVAVMGATASGKSSLVNLIPRFFDVSKGAVFVDGHDVREYTLKSLRERISYQKTELFSRSIADNIKFGKRDATDSEVQEAALVAQADGFINGTENGYQTYLAERGANLSGGQKQRLTIARALLKGAEILILDDSTSALDYRTEAAFFRALSKIPCTKIVVTARIKPEADKIILLDEGRVICGTHNELLQTSPLYQEICKSQMLEEVVNG